MKFFSQSKKQILETLNSLVWFAMDAAWMLEWKEVSTALIVPTFLSGLILCFQEKKTSLTLINVSVFSWICMNVTWMLSEMYTKDNYLLMTKVFMMAGIICMALAMYLSNNRSETFFHFKRSRLKDWF